MSLFEDPEFLTYQSLEVLTAARRLIDDAMHWTQRANARDCMGYAVPAQSDAAFAFGAKGAIYRVARKQNAHMGSEWICCKYMENASGESLNLFNDTHSHAEVLALFDSVLASLGGTA